MKFAIAALALTLTSVTAAAQSFPTKSITVIVPTAPGGGNDLIARILAQKMGPLLGQSVVVDNKAGANGSIASEYVARATPDGHTVMLGYVATHAMNPPCKSCAMTPLPALSPLA